MENTWKTPYRKKMPVAGKHLTQHLTQQLSQHLHLANVPAVMPLLENHFGAQAQILKIGRGAHTDI